MGERDSGGDGEEIVREIGGSCLWSGDSSSAAHIRGHHTGPVRQHADDVAENWGGRENSCGGGGVVVEEMCRIGKKN